MCVAIDVHGFLYTAFEQKQNVTQHFIGALTKVITSLRLVFWLDKQDHQQSFRDNGSWTFL